MSTESRIRSGLNMQLSVPLPDGRFLVATAKDSTSHPGIEIAVVSEDCTSKGMLWAEFNTARPDYAMDERLRVLLWNEADDEPAINMSYDTGSFEVENKNGVRTIAKENMPQ